MELLPEGKKNTVKVLLEDQERINEFSKLVMKKDVIEVDLDKEKQEKEYIEDVAMELELVDEDEDVQYKIGEVFVFMKQSEVVEQLERDQQRVEAKIQELQEKNDSIDIRMNELKKVLYAKFGDTINLER